MSVSEIVKVYPGDSSPLSILGEGVGYGTRDWHGSISPFKYQGIWGEGPFQRHKVRFLAFSVGPESYSSRRRQGHRPAALSCLWFLKYYAAITKSYHGLCDIKYRERQVYVPPSQSQDFARLMPV
jgi:hypothetical protein